MNHDPVMHWLSAKLGGPPVLSESGVFRVAGKSIEIRTNSTKALRTIVEDLEAHHTPSHGSEGAIHLYHVTGDVPEGVRMPDRDAVPVPDSYRESDELVHARWGDVLSFWSPDEFAVSYDREEDGPFRVVVCTPVPHAQRSDGSVDVPGCIPVVNDEKSDSETLIDISRVLLARAAGGLCLHAALVEREGRGVLICGESGSGKTTAALALGQGGYRILSDEMVIADCSDPTAIELHGYQLRPRLYRQPESSGSMDLDRLEEALSAETSGDKDWLELPRDPRPEAGDRKTILRTLLFLEPRAVRGEHATRPVSAADALMTLMGQILDPTNTFDPGRQLETISRVVEACPAHAVSLGPRLRTIPALVTNLLAESGG
jgi:hypothetical protein